MEINLGDDAGVLAGSALVLLMTPGLVEEHYRHQRLCDAQHSHGRGLGFLADHVPGFRW